MGLIITLLPTPSFQNPILICLENKKKDSSLIHSRANMHANPESAEVLSPILFQIFRNK